MIEAFAGIWLYSIAVILIGFAIARRRDRCSDAAGSDFAPPGLAVLALAVAAAPIYVLAAVCFFASNRKDVPS